MGEWLPIKSAPRGVEALFWITPLTLEDDYYVDTSGNPILAADCKPRMVMGKYGAWSSLMKATYWHPLPAPPT